jgi:magnesium transporter
VFSGSAAPTERIYFLRREVTDFYRAVHPLLAVLASQVQPKKCSGALTDYLNTFSGKV